MQIMPTPIRVTIWNEFVHERRDAAVAAIYPKGIHGLLAEVLGKNGRVSGVPHEIMKCQKNPCFALQGEFYETHLHFIHLDAF